MNSIETKGEKVFCVKSAEAHRRQRNFNPVFSRQNIIGKFVRRRQMQQSRLMLFPLLILFLAIIACNADSAIEPDNDLNPGQDDPGQQIPGSDNIGTDTSGNRLKITIGSRTFTATLLANPTVTAFTARLPMTVTMSELNGNEKLYNFSNSLPANASNPRTIATGDLMLYGSTTLVLFYESFSTSYSYTRLGKIDNPSGLAAAVGSGSVSVRYELE